MIDIYLNITSSQKLITEVSLVLKDSDSQSENLDLLIHISVTDSQKTDSSEYVSFKGI